MAHPSRNGGRPVTRSTHGCYTGEMKRLVSLLLLCIGSVGGMAGCGGDDDGPPEPSLDDFLPATPAPDGSAQSVWAGAITTEAELIPGPASTGLVGDYYMRN